MKRALLVECRGSAISKASESEQELLSRNHAERVALRVISLLKRAEVNIRDLFERAQLTCSVTEFLDGGIRSIDPERLHQLNGRALTLLTNLANRQDGRPPIRPEDWAMLMYCLISSRTLREAVTRCARFYEMLAERMGDLELHVQGGSAELRIESRHLQRNAVALVVDATGMAALHGVFGWLIGQPIPLSRISMHYDERLRAYFDSAILPYPVEFNTPRTAMLFASEYLDYPVVRTLDDYERRTGLSFLFDPEVHQGPSGAAERARRIIYGALREQSGLPTLDELSVELDCSRARLRRELAKAGASYNFIKDSCRRELALELLRRSRLSVEDIAVRLGFCDSDAFRRAFRHWMDMSPLQYRKNAAN